MHKFVKVLLYSNYRQLGQGLRFDLITIRNIKMLIGRIQFVNRAFTYFIYISVCIPPPTIETEGAVGVR